MTAPLLCYRIVRMTVSLVGQALARIELSRQPSRPERKALPWAAWRLPERFGIDRKASAAPAGPKLWAHAASLGEVAGLIQVFKHWPLPCPCIATAQTSAGLERLAAFAKEWNAGEGGRRTPIETALAPFESPSVVRRFLKEYGVTSVLLYESDCWPAYLSEAGRLSLPLYWIAARWSERTHRFWSVAPRTARAVHKPVVWVQAQTEADAQRMRLFFSCSVSIGCDAKGLGTALEASHLGAAQAITSEENSQLNELSSEAATRSSPNGLALYCLHFDEWPYVQPYLRQWMNQGPVFILPRYPHEFTEFRRECEKLGFRIHSRIGDNALESNAPLSKGHAIEAKSTLQAETTFQPEPQIQTESVLVDALGIAGTYLAQSRTCLVGGSLNGKGGHAFWEPLRYGLNLVAGPSLFHQQPLAQDLEKAGLLKILRVGDTREWESLLAQESETQALSRDRATQAFLSALVKSQKRALEDLRAIFRAS